MAKAEYKTKTEDKLTSKDIEIGAIVTESGNAQQYKTGDWRSKRPKWDFNKCNKCGLCYVYCPEGCIQPIGDGYYEADLFYCKGCGICATECPKDAITMLEEKE